MNTTAEITALGDRWAKAECAGDVEALDALADDDFRLVGPYGFVLDKQSWLDRYRSGAFDTRVLNWDDVSVADHGDIAIAIGRQTQEAAYQGRRSDGEFRVSQVFARKPGGWRLIGMHISLATPPQGN